MELPKYYIIGARPVMVIPTEDGGMDIQAFDWQTGEFVRAIEYLTAIAMPEYTDLLNDIEEVTEEEFKKAVEKLREDIRK